MLTENFFGIAEIGHEATLWLLLLLSVLSVATIIDRFLALRAPKRSSSRVHGQVLEILQSNNLQEAEDLSRDRESVEGRGAAYGLRHLREKGAEGLEEVFNSYALVERPRLEKNLNFLATVGSNAPFIGLLGTVFGIMDAFRQLAATEGDASLVMIGISKALVATAVGLLVAIPAVVAYNFFQRQVRGILQNLDSVKELCLAFAKTKKDV